ncbi:hypothetical protein ATANTOWER_028093 [Ataeniobius toweri]|uniref:Uncharacterized protein n=1 Tax=Ataeniobius toweri TaxID=208326 RepID=A0ABU7B3H7_9TELE|nr:hypothetical protein [Ataeniobius toweri]
MKTGSQSLSFYIIDSKEIKMNRSRFDLIVQMRLELDGLRSEPHVWCVSAMLIAQRSGVFHADGQPCRGISARMDEQEERTVWGVDLPLCTELQHLSIRPSGCLLLPGSSQRFTCVYNYCAFLHIFGHFKVFFQ